MLQGGILFGERICIRDMDVRGTKNRRAAGPSACLEWFCLFHMFREKQKTGFVPVRCLI